MDDAVTDLLDRFQSTMVELDDMRPLWDGDIEQIERWPSTSADHTAAARERWEALRDEARALLPAAAVDDAPSLHTAADAAAMYASNAEHLAEVAWVHPLTGLHAYLHWAVNDLPLRTAEHGARYLAKIVGFRAAADELATRVSQAAAAGRGPITSHALRAAEAMEAQLATAVEEDPILQQAPPTELGVSAAAQWREQLDEAVEEHLRPGLAHLATTLRDDCAPAGRDDDHCGMVHRPDGEHEYLAMLRGFTTPDSDPQQVHDTGRAQLARLEGEYSRLGQRVFGVSDPAEVRRRLVEDPALRCSTTDEVMERARELHARAVDEAPRWFNRTPVAACDVRSTEHGAVGFYARPAQDGSRPGVFYLNTSEPGIWGTQLATTVFHEGIPGHHYQLALAQEDTDLHDVHRTLSLPAFSEGWALYAEQLADEIGLFQTDVDRLGMLVADSMRACRMVVDTGMHAFGWGRQQAIDVMVDNVPLDPSNVAAEIDRYIGWPGQATSYMTGRLEIERLRADAEVRLAGRFSLPDFHDVVLSRGMVSLPALRTMVASWEATEG